MPVPSRPYCPGRCAVLLLASLHLPAPAVAQAPPPATEYLTFTCVIQGSGSDPMRGDAISRATQGWTYSRVITGWFEVESTRKQVGKGASAHQRLEFRLPDQPAHQIVGLCRDEVHNQYTESGEGGGQVTYTADEARTGDLELPPPGRPFRLGFDAGSEPSWDGMFLPLGWLAAIEAAARYEGHAHYDPQEGAGFGTPWRYHIDNPFYRDAGERYVHVRYTPSNTGVLPISPLAAAQRWPGWFDGKVARGHVELETPRPPNAQGSFTMRYLLDWSVHAELDDVELEVRSRNYESWRPQAADDSAAEPRGAGPALYLQAELRARDRRTKKPLPKIAALTWRLLGTSREPGVAMNWPYDSRDRRFDLELVAGDLTPAQDDDNQTLVLHPDGPRADVAVFPFDWGGWATLRVEARLEDGRVIEGTLLSPSGGRLTEIPIPNARPGSRVARSWLVRHCPDFGADTDDRDSQPIGRGDGDGFSVYEEYRGFQVDGAHLSTEPGRKDLFVRAGLVRAAVPGALEQFAQVSGLAVHDRVLAAEMATPGRVMNPNRRHSPSNGPQTGLCLELGKGTARFNDRIPAGARPVDVPVIEVPDPAAVARLSSRMDLLADLAEADLVGKATRHMVVQALLQACGVERPGASDQQVTVQFVPAEPGTGAIPHHLLDGKPVHIDRENGVCMDEVWQRSHERGLAAGATMSWPAYTVLLGRRGGAHSGPERCVMRDWYADLYLSDAVRDGLPVYRVAPMQEPGTALGTTRRGTGINQSGRTPSACFGDSEVAQPARQQLAVKDGGR